MKKSTGCLTGFIPKFYTIRRVHINFSMKATKPLSFNLQILNPTKYFTFPCNFCFNKWDSPFAATQASSTAWTKLLKTQIEEKACWEIMLWYSCSPHFCCGLKSWMSMCVAFRAPDTIASCTIFVDADVRIALSKPEAWLPTAEGDFPGAIPNPARVLCAIFSICGRILDQKSGVVSA